MQNVTLKIHGMSCGHCVMAVKGALKDLPGVEVQSVQVGSAVVAVSAPATAETVREAIENEGYQVVEVN